MDNELHMIQAEINTRSLYQWMALMDIDDVEYAMHCVLRESFGDLAPRPYRLKNMAGNSSTGVLYGYTKANSNALQEATAIFSSPKQSSIIPSDSICSKPIMNYWQPGKQMGFEVRVRPVVRPKRENDTNYECDAFLKSPADSTREDAYSNWLTQQFEIKKGAVLEQAQMVSYCQSRIVRKRRSFVRDSEGPDVVMARFVACY